MMAIAYGSVPIIREASESTSADDLMLKQEPFYNVIDWADQEMLEASKQLPATQTEDKKYGRVTSVGYYAAFFVFMFMLKDDLDAMTFQLGWALCLPAISIILNYLSFRAIYRDEVMVKAADRLR